MRKVQEFSDFRRTFPPQAQFVCVLPVLYKADDRYFDDPVQRAALHSLAKSATHCQCGLHKPTQTDFPGQGVGNSIRVLAESSNLFPPFAHKLSLAVLATETAP